MAAPVVVIAGPTASGKSSLALALAEALDGAVINADSMQIYRELLVLTARPGAEALARAPHRLFGSAPANTPYSAGKWREQAVREIAACHAAGRLPLVVGGTGLYLKALMTGIAAVPPIAPEIRDRVRADMATHGAGEMHRRLTDLDPAGAAAIRTSDPQRIARALEVVEATGRTLADWQGEASAAPAEDWSFYRVLIMPERDALYAACDARFDAMLAHGALEEARALEALAVDPGLPVMKALGVGPLLSHLRGEIGLDDAADQAKRDTRRYARRQMTWFRHQFAPDHVVTEQYSESVFPKIFALISAFRLTHPG